MKLQKTTKNHNSEKEEKNLEVPCYCKTTVIKTGWYWQQNKTKQHPKPNQNKNPRHIDQWANWRGQK